MDLDSLDVSIIDPRLDPRERAEARAFLASCGLDDERGLEAMVLFRAPTPGRREIVACGGLEANIVKCVAISPTLRGEAIGLRLLTEVTHLATERGHSHLFLYTKPENVPFFASCGFYLLAEAKGHVALMENTPVGVATYRRTLSARRVEGAKIGAVVMNANPFTLGHRFLVEQAAAQCDWLHVFVVSEDVSFFPYAQRYALVKAGLAGLDRVSIHEGSAYMVSRATFSAYFFKEKGIVGDCFTAIDLLVFRDHIAPALGITHRFVGTEPFCPTTAKYNADMKHWLARAPSDAPPVAVVELLRCMRDGVPISASEVRRRLKAGDLAGLARLVPTTTYALLARDYAPLATPAAAGACS